ncbi:MAG TPA: DUF6496 domain-containing protein [Parafilimonas sp.]|nr:DUF6496 domain-containing protein [Parafilimonas sp.]
MPDKSTIEKAKKDKAQGKSASTQAGEFVHDEIEKVRKGKHGVRSVKQAIAIGLSEARRSGVQLSPPKSGDAALKKKARQDEEKAKSNEPVSPKRSRAKVIALKQEPTNTVSSKALSKQAKSAAKERSASSRSAAAKKAAGTRAKNKSK